MASKGNGLVTGHIKQIEKKLEYSNLPADLGSNCKSRQKSEAATQ
jgi:hypothetical protein